MNNQWEKADHIDESIGSRATTNPTLKRLLTKFSKATNSFPQVRRIGLIRKKNFLPFAMNLEIAAFFRTTRNLLAKIPTTHTPVSFKLLLRNGLRSLIHLSSTIFRPSLWEATRRDIRYTTCRWLRWLPMANFTHKAY